MQTTGFAVIERQTRVPAETPLTVTQLPAPRTVSANVDSDFEHTHGYVARLSQNRSKPVQYLGCADFGTIEGLHTCFQKAAFRVRAPGKAGSALFCRTPATQPALAPFSLWNQAVPPFFCEQAGERVTRACERKAYVARYLALPR